MENPLVKRGPVLFLLELYVQDLLNSTISTRRHIQYTDKRPVGLYSFAADLNFDKRVSEEK